jgi:hypothetical protein
MHSPPPPEFGIALELIGRLNMPLNPSLLGSLRNAAYAGTLTILRSATDAPVGFVCWAGVNKDSVRIADQFNLFPSHFWEFKEGKIALLLFVFFAYPCNEEARSAFMEFLDSRHAVYFMKKNKKRLAIRTSRGFRYARVN